MSQQNDFSHLIDLNLTTAITNILGICDQRQKALYLKSKDIGQSIKFELYQAMQAAIYACHDPITKDQLIDAIQQANIFYETYDDVLDEPLVQFQENRVLTYVKNKFASASINSTYHNNITINTMISDAFQKHNILKHSHSIDTGLLSRMKRKFRNSEKDE